MVPPLVLIAIAALSMSLPLLGWSVLARPNRERRQTVVNLQRGLTGHRGRPRGPAGRSPDPAGSVLSRDA